MRLESSSIEVTMCLSFCTTDPSVNIQSAQTDFNNQHFFSQNVYELKLLLTAN